MTIRQLDLFFRMCLLDLNMTTRLLDLFYIIQIHLILCWYIHGNFIKIDHVLDQKENVNKFLKVENFSGHSVYLWQIKLKVKKKVTISSELHEN